MTHTPEPPILPPNRFSQPGREALLDAAAVLQVRRSEIAAQLTDGARQDAEIVAVGRVQIGEWMYETGLEWSALVSTRPVATLAELQISVPVNRYFIERGTEMFSLFDYAGTEPAGRALLANETLGNYLFGICPVQMKIIDRRFVLLGGPTVDGQQSVMKVTSDACMEAAWRYWEAAVAAAIPAEPADVATQLTSRQLQVVGLLADDLDDESIAEALGVSVRTVRSDIAAVLGNLGVRSRFAAAARLQLGAGLPD